MRNWAGYQWDVKNKGNKKKNKKNKNNKCIMGQWSKIFLCVNYINNTVGVSYNLIILLVPTEILVVVIFLVSAAATAASASTMKQLWLGHLLQVTNSRLVINATLIYEQHIPSLRNNILDRTIKIITIFTQKQRAEGRRESAVDDWGAVSPCSIFDT